MGIANAPWGSLKIDIASDDDLSQKDLEHKQTRLKVLGSEIEMIPTHRPPSRKHLLAEELIFVWRDNGRDDAGQNCTKFIRTVLESQGMETGERFSEWLRRLKTKSRVDNTS